jgi:hypothetical protein
MQALTTSWYVSYWVIDVSPIIGHFEGGAQGLVSYLGRALKLRPITPLTCSMGDKSGDRAGQACPPDILLKISLYKFGLSQEYPVTNKTLIRRYTQYDPICPPTIAFLDTTAV